MPHTPGPWSLLGAQIIGGLREDGATYHRICEMVTHSMEDTETIRANADLICAAPDLLLVCKALLGTVCTQKRWRERWPNVHKVALAIIAKAEGKEKECVTESGSSDAA